MPLSDAMPNYGLDYTDPRLGMDAADAGTQDVLARMAAQKAAKEREPYEALTRIAATLMTLSPRGAPGARPLRQPHAQEQEWSPGWYHGTGADKFDKFRPNTYMTNRPEEASRYAEIASRQDGGHPSVMPLHSRGRYATQEDMNAAEAALRKTKSGYVSSRDVFAELKKRGFDGFEEADASGRAMRLVFDPSNIRSKFGAPPE